MNQIPTAYKWSGSYRFVSPEGQEIAKKDLRSIPCPKCGRFTLTNREYNFMSILSGYMVTCSACDWMPRIYLEECPTEEASLGAFKLWLEAYTLAGSDKDNLTIDTRNLLNDEN